MSPMVQTADHCCCQPGKRTDPSFPILIIRASIIDETGIQTRTSTKTVLSTFFELQLESPFHRPRLERRTDPIPLLVLVTGALGF